jgi:murein DD-endopeptidase MepM/ murein hydrolase activator NlpD
VGRSTRRCALCITLVLTYLGLVMPASAAETTGAPHSRGDTWATAAEPAARDWIWPAERFRLAEAFVAPAHAYGPGHRGIDLDLLGDTVVRAPADGVVAFAGSVAGRGILTIDHGDGLVTTLEPVDTDLAPGTPVRRGEDLATLAAGGHAATGALHFGVRLHGEYINPLVLLGGVPRAVLLPCCE